VAVRRFVFQPRWILGHLFVVAAALTCIRLADWQLSRAHITEALQNWGYAFQWPLFSIFFLIGWWRMLRLESIRLDELEAAEAGQTQDGADDAVAAEAPVVTKAEAREPEATFEDEQHAAYNRMLAKLASQDAARDEAGRR
jgi:DNA-binding transcriptional regulator of glucitol operon